MKASIMFKVTMTRRWKWKQRTNNGIWCRYYNQIGILWA